MRSSRLTDLFALFFDPRLPLLFLLGSLVLAVLGNAVYDLLVSALGSTPSSFAAIAFTAVLVLVLLLLLTRAALRALERRRVPPVGVPAEQRAAPHAGLVLLVSSNPAGSEPAVLAWHRPGATLRHCWLVVSPDAAARASDLEFRLHEQNVRTQRLAINDATQASLAYAAVLAGLDEAARLPQAQPVIVDLTGGTKPMSVGAALACVARGVPMSYLVSARHQDGRPNPAAQPVAMQVLPPAAQEIPHADPELRAPADA